MENMEVIKTPEEVQSRIRELGAEIAKAYGTEPLTMLVVMNGGLFFAAKLAEAIDSDDFYIDSTAAGSYRGNVRAGDVRGRHVLIVDEVLDTGRTLKLIRDNLMNLGALSVKTAVLVEKVLPRPEGIAHADWAGFFMDDRYLVGCGMDSHEKYRQYPGIAVLS